MMGRIVQLVTIVPLNLNALSTTGSALCVKSESLAHQTLQKTIFISRMLTMPLIDPKKPLPTIVRQGAYQDAIEFSLPDGTTGFAIVVSKPVGVAADVAQAMIERYNHHPHLVDLLQRLNDAVQALDGTSVDNEALVDEYNALLAGLSS